MTSLPHDLPHDLSLWQAYYTHFSSKGTRKALFLEHDGYVITHVQVIRVFVVVAASACPQHHPHAQQMMVICSPLSGFLALWSSHCQVKIVPMGQIVNRPPNHLYYQKLLFSVARGVAWLSLACCSAVVGTSVQSAHCCTT